MKRIALVCVFLAAAAGAGYAANPDEFKQYAAAAAKAARPVWASVEANPAPVLLALGTFLLTVVYYKAKGKSLRESVAVAATRVTVIPVPVKDEADGENRAVARAKARAARTQLMADQVLLQNRLRKLPEEVTKAEKDACYTEQAAADAERALAARRKAHDDAVAKLDALRVERAAGDAELAEIEAGLKKLADRV
jgi:hypothetical protein